jgi:SagB-type dehydrogenase family enzyme
MLPYNDPLSLALLFHLNSEPWLNAAAYDDPHAHPEFKNVESTQECVTLPDPDPSQVIALASRRLSCRDFNAQPVTVKELATVLHAAYGIVGVRAWPNGRKTFARAVPSAGGLYPLELYVACDQVEGVASGIYHFELRGRRLEPVAVPCSIQELVPDLLDQHYVCGAAALLLFTAVLSRTSRKYGPRGYRYMLIEAGHAAQNAVLQATDMGLATLCVAGFRDHQINRRLRLDGVGEVTLYGVAIGRRG